MFDFGKNKKKKQPKRPQKPSKSMGQMKRAAPSPPQKYRGKGPSSPPSKSPQSKSKKGDSPFSTSGNSSPFEKKSRPKRPSSVNKEEVGDIAESVFSEKTEDLVNKLDEIKKWQKKVISRLDTTEKEIGYLRKNVKQSRDSVSTKLEDNRKKIKEINVEIKVMEKIFRQIMPPFVESIKELKEIVGDMKGFSQYKTESSSKKKSKKSKKSKKK